MVCRNRALQDTWIHTGFHRLWDFDFARVSWATEFGYVKDEITEMFLFVRRGCNFYLNF